MLMLIKLILTATVAILVLDGIWLGFIAKSFYLSHMGDLLTVKQGSIQANIPAAVLVYCVLVGGILIFVYPLAQGSVLKALVYGALFGLAAYGTYDFTNMALVRGWSWTLTIVDVIWGMVICSLTSVAVVWLNASA